MDLASIQSCRRPRQTDRSNRTRFRSRSNLRLLQVMSLKLSQSGTTSAGKIRAKGIGATAGSQDEAGTHMPSTCVKSACRRRKSCNMSPVEKSC